MRVIDESLDDDQHQEALKFLGMLLFLGHLYAIAYARHL